MYISRTQGSACARLSHRGRVCYLKKGFTSANSSPSKGRGIAMFQGYRLRLELVWNLKQEENNGGAPILQFKMMENAKKAALVQQERLLSSSH